MMTAEQYESTSRTLRDGTLQALEGLGWSRRAERLLYHHVQESRLRHPDMDAYTLEREYSFEAYGSLIEGTASLDSAEVERIVRLAVSARVEAADGQWTMGSTGLGIVFRIPHGGVSHPHANVENSCMGLSPRHLPDDWVMAAVNLAGAITRLIEVVDLSGPLNTEWGTCHSCGAQGLIGAEHCGDCDNRYCEGCYNNPSEHECLGGGEDDGPEDEPDEEIERRQAESEDMLPAWRGGARDRAPRLPQAVGTCFLVGCGVTGSWVAPILMRASQRFTVIDPDALDGASPHGLWTAGQGPKVQAVPFGRYAIRGLTVRYRGQGADADLFVLCPDNAQARLTIDDNECEVGQVLDIRATPSGLTVWAIRDDEGGNDGAWKAWRRSLEGYREPEACHHDNVPIKAGTLAAAFVAWWITSGRPDGIWTIPYGYEGMAFNQGGGG